MDKYKIFNIIYNSDGSKKEFYNLSIEKDIKETQLKSDENELEFNYSQKKISEEEYKIKKKELDNKLLNQNKVYDILIFDLIKNQDINSLKEQIKNANLNSIDLKRLSSSLSSIAENKINDFINNNKEFKKENLKLWNYKYDVIAKSYAKTRELESYILNLIK